MDFSVGQQFAMIVPLSIKGAAAEKSGGFQAPRETKERDGQQTATGCRVSARQPVTLISHHRLLIDGLNWPAGDESEVGNVVLAGP
jgi:hypothetical protein